MADRVVVSRYRLHGLHCADCARVVERAVAGLNGVDAVDVAFATGIMRVTHRGIAQEALQEAVRRAGYRAEPVGDPGSLLESVPWWRQPRLLATLTAGALLLAGTAADSLGAAYPWARLACGAAIAVGGWFPAAAAVRALRLRQLDMNVLMTIAALGAAAIGEWVEGAVVVFLFSLGESLEHLALERTRRSIRSLMDMAPAEAELLRDGRPVRVPVAEVRPGDRVVVRPGARIPVDGRVVEGLAAVNEAAITGEALAVDKAPGDDVFAGTVNEHGYLEVEARRVGGDTTLARIIHLVEEAQGRRAPAQRWVDRFAARYTPLVVLAAALTALLPPLWGAPWQPWLYRALALIILACPCALVISTPVAVVTAIGRAASGGVLIKGGAYLEAAGAVRTVAFDKTGTLTMGRPEVTAVIPLTGGAGGAGPAADEVLRLAAALERRSEHPLARAVVAAAEARDLLLPAVEAFTVMRGRGVRGRVEGRDLVLGSIPWVAAEAGVDPAAVAAAVRAHEDAGHTLVALAERGRWLGLIALSDPVRPGAADVIARLRAAGVRRVVMLTGDGAAPARRVAAAVGVDEVRARLLPDQKLAAIEELERESGPVLMVGDGVNDAPALARASVGVAMGAAGTDSALEAADVALMADDLAQLPFIVDLGRRTLGIIRQNVVFSLLVKAAALALLAAGRLSLWLAILADTGASLVVIANGLRLLRVKGPRTQPRPPRTQPRPEPDGEMAAPSRTSA